ncbi:MAG: Trm112 family protein [Planctomycetota bacterium]
MIDKELLDILACPETHQPLALADEALLERVNARIAAGGAKNVGGADVTEALAAGLVREDGKVVYPIRDEIPVLLIDEGLSTDG